MAICFVHFLAINDIPLSEMSFGSHYVKFTCYMWILEYKIFGKVSPGTNQVFPLVRDPPAPQEPLDDKAS